MTVMPNAMMEAAMETGACWPGPRPVGEDLLEWIGEGPLATARSKGNGAVEGALMALRRQDVTSPVIYLGTGTCGLGAGAGKTLTAVKAYVARAGAQGAPRSAGHADTAGSKRADGSGLELEVVEVGCVGLCSEEPILDVQLPGRPRISFGGV
jgi:hypothetical protein